jgi:hypothetical protein
VSWIEAMGRTSDSAGLRVPMGTLAVCAPLLLLAVAAPAAALTVEADIEGDLQQGVHTRNEVETLIRETSSVLDRRPGADREGGPEGDSAPGAEGLLVPGDLLPLPQEDASSRRAQKKRGQPGSKDPGSRGREKDDEPRSDPGSAKAPDKDQGGEEDDLEHLAAGGKEVGAGPASSAVPEDDGSDGSGARRDASPETNPALAVTGAGLIVPTSSGMGLMLAGLLLLRGASRRADEFRW